MDGFAGGTPRGWKVISNFEDGRTVYEGFFQLEPLSDEIKADATDKAFVDLVNNQLSAFVGETEDSGSTDRTAVRVARARSDYIKDVAEIAQLYIDGYSFMECARRFGEAHGRFSERTRAIRLSTQWQVEVIAETAEFADDVLHKNR